MSSVSLPSAPPLTIFQSLVERFPTWDHLHTFLKSEQGGRLRVDDHATEAKPFVLIRYVKGKSNLALPHTRAFRSVVWDILKNRPVSVAPMKSEDGESLPTTTDNSTAGYTIERFVDGVMFCGFYDQYNKEWCFHTRSTLGGDSRYYSQTKTFLEMFQEAVTANSPTDKAQAWTMFLSMLDVTTNYVWVLQHPENRIVVNVPRPKMDCVQRTMIDQTGKIQILGGPMPFDVMRIVNVATWDDLRAKLTEDVRMFKYNTLGYVVKDTEGRRWKIRGKAYNEVRALRGNSARRDFLWLSLWRAAKLRTYLAIYPEETAMANAVVDKWKLLSRGTYQIYCDVFKARSMPKTQIPPKYRPFVFGLHNLYITDLKPQGKSVDWATALKYMNTRDTAQALFAINWEIRMSSPTGGKSDKAIPLDAPSAVGTTFVASQEQLKVTEDAMMESLTEAVAAVTMALSTAEAMVE